MSIQENLSTYVPVYDVAPDKYEEARDFLVERLRNITESLNAKEVGSYNLYETLTGRAFVPTATNTQVFRDVYRTVVDFGALPAAGTASVAHGIADVDVNFTLMHMYASASDPVAFSYLPIPYASAADPIEMNMDATNINITVSSDRSAYTRCFVIIEYLREI